MARQGIEIDRSTLVFWVGVAAAELKPIYLHKGLRVLVVRPPPSVHGDGDRGFVPILIGIAREKGVSAYIGGGLDRWPAVHRLDAAHLSKLVIGKGTSGTRYHGIAEEGIAFREIAEVIGRRLNVPVVRKLTEEAAAHFAWFAHFAGIDAPSSSEKRCNELGWQPMSEAARNSCRTRTLGALLQIIRIPHACVTLAGDVLKRMLEPILSSRDPHKVGISNDA
jgi:hypothetical protein